MLQASTGGSCIPRDLPSLCQTVLWASVNVCKGHRCYHLNCQTSISYGKIFLSNATALLSWLQVM